MEMTAKTKSAESETRTTLANAVPLSDIVRTDALWQRPRRSPDYETENRALTALVQALADSPATILQTLADTVLHVLKVGSAGLSLLAKDETRFYWAAIAGGWKPHLGEGTPRDFGPCGDVLDGNTPMLFTHWERRYPYLAEATPLAEEGLLVPFEVDGKAVGTIWAIVHDERRPFDAEDLRQLQSLRRFASAAYRAVQLQHAEVLIGELNHRVRNTLATVQSIAAHTLTSSSDRGARQNFDARLVALSRTHDLLARGSWEGVSLRELLLHEFEPFRSASGIPFQVEGPDLELRPKAALALGMAFHELTTNAAKYGALSAPQGRVRVTWDTFKSAEATLLRLSWTEIGGPPIRNTGHKGFGTKLIESGLSYELDGSASLAFEPGGLRCTIEIPLPPEK